MKRIGFCPITLYCMQIAPSKGHTDVTSVMENASHIWIDQPRLYFRSRQDIIGDKRLCDEVINACQEMLKLQFPNTAGLCDPILLIQQTVSVSASADVVQIVHDSGHKHWITVSTIGCKSNEINIFCSLQYTPSEACIKTITRFIKFTSRHITLHIMNVSKQTNTVDCGLYAIAYATSLLNGNDPVNLNYKQTAMRQHVVTSLETFSLSEFPAASMRTVRNKLTRMKECKLHCVCYTAFCKSVDTDMIMCSYCAIWYHKDCINMDDIHFNNLKMRNSRFCCDACAVQQ